MITYFNMFLSFFIDFIGCFTSSYFGLFVFGLAFMGAFFGLIWSVSIGKY